MNRWLSTVTIGASVVAGVFVSAVIILKFAGFLALYSVPTDGMATFIRRGDHIVAHGFWPGGRMPKRGEVVTFTTAGIQSQYMNMPEPVIFIKRAVGLPGDRLEFKGEILHINDRPVSEYFDTTGITYLPMMSLENGSITVPPEHIFVMGDNSGNSLDSRYWGPLPVENLRQKYWFHAMRGKSAEKNPTPNTL